jgi:hypothetical protein
MDTVDIEIFAIRYFDDGEWLTIGVYDDFNHALDVQYDLIHQGYMTMLYSH